MMFINDCVISKIKEETPELNQIDDAEALISHILNNPDIDYPFCSSIIKSRIVKNASSNQSLPNDKLKFIDLFAGIGGFHQAFSSLNCRCVFSSEWDPYAKKTYFSNYGIVPFGDIRLINAADIPNHDVLCAGFPCQPFSIAGVSKKNSMKLATGFEDKTQGTLFFDVARIINEKRPKVFFLENVKNLLSHNKGKTWKIILKTLSQELNYQVFYKIIDGKAWVPQHRERIFIIGFDKKRYKEQIDFVIPSAPDESYHYRTLDQIIESRVDKKYTLSDGTWRALQKHKENHLSKGNGFGFKLLPYPITPDVITSTISARYYKDGAEILVPQELGKNPRKLTVNEAMQLQGYDPEHFVFPVSNVHAYKQIGNSVVVPAIKTVATALIRKLREMESNEPCTL